MSVSGLLVRTIKTTGTIADYCVGAAVGSACGLYATKMVRKRHFRTSVVSERVQEFEDEMLALKAYNVLQVVSDYIVMLDGIAKLYNVPIRKIERDEVRGLVKMMAQDVKDVLENPSPWPDDNDWGDDIDIDALH